MPPASCPSNQQRSNPSEEKKSSSWFSSWFENDNMEFKDQIHEKLNDLEAYQQRYERRNPFFFPQNPNPEQAAAAASTLHREIEEFFESAGLGGLADPQRWPSSSSSSSSSFSRISNGTTYQIMRQENHNGVQIEVKFPQKIEPQDVAVEVVEEYPCVVQWRNGSTFRDQARLGRNIDCSKLSASISTAKNILTVEAPAISTSRREDTQPRRIQVTERDE
jgi:hypothetical protein